MSASSIEIRDRHGSRGTRIGRRDDSFRLGRLLGRMADTQAMHAWVPLQLHDSLPVSFLPKGKIMVGA